MNDLGVIHLRNGGFAVVDADLFDGLNQHSWFSTKDGYVCRDTSVDGVTKRIRLHREVLKPKDHELTDHENGFRIDNTRRNLRPANFSQNCTNRRKRSGCSSQYIGVAWHKKSQKWGAHVGAGLERHSVGYFDNELDAALAYDLAAQVHYGEFARTNILKYG